MRKSSRVAFRPVVIVLICGAVTCALVIAYIYNNELGGKKGVQVITMVQGIESPSIQSSAHQNASISNMNIISGATTSTNGQSPAAMQKAKVPAFSASSAQKSLSKPVIMSVVTSHYLGDYHWKSSTSDPCPLANPVDNTTIRLQCDIQGDASSATTADGLWYHLPSIQNPDQVQRHHPKQVRAGFSMESNVYYGQQNNPDLMKEFEIKMTYELDSDVITTYFWDDPTFHQPPKVSFAQKSNAVGYVNRNCGASNGRHEIIKTLANHYTVTAYGCMGSQERVDKIDFFSKQKFCVAMENSNAKDYVSEKLWQAFQSGCLPIYLGAPNIVEDFLPTPNAAIVYDPATSTPEKLAQRLKKLDSNEALYNEAMAWRTMPLEKLSPGFQTLLTGWRAKGRTECQLCRKVALWRLAKEQPGPLDVSWFLPEKSMQRLRLDSNNATAAAGRRALVS